MMMSATGRSASPNFRAMADCRRTVKRRLFGETDHNHVRGELRRFLTEAAKRDQINWNFDFTSGKPLVGKYQWELMSAPLIANVRQNVMRATPAPTTTDLPVPDAASATASGATSAGSAISSIGQIQSPTRLYSDCNKSMDRCHLELKSTRPRCLPLPVPITKDEISMSVEELEVKVDVSSSPMLRRSMSMTESSKSLSQHQITG